LSLSTPIIRPRPPRFHCGLGLGALLFVFALGLRAQEPIVAGSMPEDYLPGLRAIVESSQKQSPTMILNAIAIAQAEANLLSSDASLYPHIYASGNYGVSKESVGVGGEAGAPGSSATSTSTAASYSVGAGMPIFQWGAVWNQTRISKLQVLIARRAYAEAYRTLVVSVRDGYLTLVLKKLGLRNVQTNLTLIQKQYALAQAQLKSGMIANGAIVGPRLAAEDTQLAYDRAVDDYTHSKHILAQLAGLKDIDDADVAADVPAPSYSAATADALLGTFLRDGAKSTYQATSLEMSIKQQQLSYRIAEVAQLPKFSANAGYGLTNSTSISLAAPSPGAAAVPAAIAQEAVSSLSYGVSASWDIFDGFAANAAIRSARQTKRYYERQLQTYLETSEEQAQEYRHQLDYSYRALKLAETRHDLAQAALDQTTADNEYGAAPQSAVDNANYSLYVSEYARASARVDFLSRWSTYVSLLGVDPALRAVPVKYVRAFR
jgi:outer membrane protein